MSVTSPALDAWHRKVVGEAARRCLKPLEVYEEMPCFCFLGHPPNTREPCTKGHCSNVNDMPRTVLDVALAYANGRGEIEDAEELANTRLCYSGPNWIKHLMALATNSPRVVICFPDPFKMLDEDITYFLEHYI